MLDTRLFQEHHGDNGVDAIDDLSIEQAFGDSMEHHYQLQHDEWIFEELDHAVTTLESIRDEQLDDKSTQWLTQEVVGIGRYSQEGIGEAIAKAAKKIWETIKSAFRSIKRFFEKIYEFVTGQTKQSEQRKKKREEMIEKVEKNIDKIFKGTQKGEQAKQHDIDIKEHKEAIESILNVVKSGENGKITIPANLSFDGSQDLKKIFEDGINANKKLLAKVRDITDKTMEARNRFKDSLSKASSGEEVDEAIKEHLEKRQEIEQELADELDDQPILPNGKIKIHRRDPKDSEKDFDLGKQRIDKVEHEQTELDETKVKMELDSWTMVTNVSDFNEEAQEAAREVKKEQDKQQPTEDATEALQSLVKEDVISTLSQRKVNLILSLAYGPREQPLGAVSDLIRINAKAQRAINSLDNKTQQDIEKISHAVDKLAEGQLKQFQQLWNQQASSGTITVDPDERS